MIKLMIAVTRRAGMTPEAFREHLGSVHAALVRDCPATRRYVRRYVQSYTLAGTPARYDGAAELWFDSVDDMNRFFADPDYLANVRPDEARFADLEASAFFVTEERRIV